MHVLGSVEPIILVPAYWHQYHHVLVCTLILVCAHLHTDEKKYGIWYLLISTKMDILTCIWHTPYLCLECGTTCTYIYTKEETHDMHQSLVPTTHIVWYITYVNIIMVHSEMHSMENDNHKGTIVNRNSDWVYSTYVCSFWRYSSHTYAIYIYTSEKGLLRSFCFTYSWNNWWTSIISHNN